MFYEVRCERCQTSFAPETRRCIHCGARLKRAAAPPRAARSEPPAPAKLPSGVGAPSGADAQSGVDGAPSGMDGGAAGGDSAQAGLPPGIGEGESSEEAPQKRIFWGAVTGLLAMLGALLRDCF